MANLNLTACPIIFRVRAIDGTWADYSDQVETFAYTSASLPDGQPGGVLQAWMEINLIDCDGGEPIDNYKDPYLFHFKQETEIQILADDGQYDFVPSKQWVIHGTPERQDGRTVRNRLELGCIQRLRDTESPFDSTAMDIKLGGNQITPIQALITRAFRLAGIFTSQDVEFTATLNYPRNFGNNYIDAADELLRSGCQISWSTPQVFPNAWASGINQGIDAPTVFVSSIDIDAEPFRKVRWDSCEIARMDPDREPIRADNGNLLADRYIATCTNIYKYKETPSPLTSPDTDDADGQTVTTTETIDFNAISSTTVTSENQMGSTLYDGLPGNFPTGSTLAQETRHFKLWNSNGDKSLIEINERIDQRCAITMDAVKGFLTGEKRRLQDRADSGNADADELARLSSVDAAIASFNWQDMIQGAKEKTIKYFYRGDRRIEKITTVERATPVEILSGLGNSVDWLLVIEECAILLKNPRTSRITTQHRWESGFGRWHERTTVRVPKAAGTSNHRTDLANRLEAARQGEAALDEAPDPNIPLYCQIIQESLGMVALPPVTRVLDNGETKPESLDTAPERWSAEQTQVSGSYNFPNTQTPDIHIEKELTMPYAGDFNANGFGGQASAEAFCRRYARHTGELARAKQFTWDGQGPVWRELLGDTWRPWMAFDYEDRDGTIYRVAFDGISIVGNQQSCRWEQRLVTLGQVDANGTLIFNYTQVQ